MRIKKNILFILLFFIVITKMFTQQQPTYIGIPSNIFNYIASSQNMNQWCWAASIEMVLKYYGINIEQEDIVYKSYGVDPFGQLPNWAGSFQVITENLNNWGIDRNGQTYYVRAIMGNGAPPPNLLINEISNKRPVIIGYNTGSSGHAVVITALSYINTFNGPVITSIIVRDPWPDEINIQNLGRREYPGIDLASKIMSYWIISVNN
jgi:hypothetical protein